MDLIENLFRGFPWLWGGGVAHSVMILSLVITTGLALGKVKVAHVSLGLMWVLFVGLIFGYCHFNLDVHLLHFLKEFGLILFVYSIGLEVGPGFISSFKKGGFQLNLLSAIVIALSIIMTIAIHFATGTSMAAMAGVLSGAVTNTPGLGAAQQAFSDMTHGAEATATAMAYAVAYPVGIIGVIIAFALLKVLLHISKGKEEMQAERGLSEMEDLSVRTFSVEVVNERVIGKTVADVKHLLKRNFVIVEKLAAGESAKCESVNGASVIEQNDRLLIVASPKDIDGIVALLGHETEMDWKQCRGQLSSRTVIVTRQDINGHRLDHLKMRSNFGTNVTKITRSGVELVPTSDLRLQLGDRLTIVGSELGLSQAEKLLGNQMRNLNIPNLIPVFLGIALGCILANIPFFIPGISESLKLGLTGGPLIVAILIGHFGPRYNLVTYNTISANLMVREIGICIFLACVGLGTGESFFTTVFNTTGLQWLGYGALITMVPILVGGFIGRYVFHLNYYTILGVLSGANTNPPALSYSASLTSSDAPSIGYSTVYPFAMFLRIVTIQILILVFL